MLLLLRRKALSFTRIGKWWHRGVEIDLVALDEETSTAYFIEYEWGEADAHTARKLIAKAQHFPGEGIGGRKNTSSMLGRP